MLPKDRQETPDCDDPNSPPFKLIYKGTIACYILITADKMGCVSNRGRFEHPVVIRISAQLPGACDRHEFGCRRETLDESFGLGDRRPAHTHDAWAAEHLK